MAHIQGTYYPEGLVSEKEVKEKFGKRIDGIDTEKVKPFIILYNQKIIGYIQTWKLSDSPKYQKLLDLSFDASGIDLFIGEKEYLGKGLGSEIIKKFIKEIIVKLFNLPRCIAGPDEGNTPSVKSFEKAGFSHIKTVYNPYQDFNEHIMMIEVQN